MSENEEILMASILGDCHQELLLVDRNRFIYDPLYQRRREQSHTKQLEDGMWCRWVALDVGSAV